MDRLPLEGIRIADFTQVVQGPYATMMLGEMGAEVIKIETESRTPIDTRSGGGFSRLNGSKKSVTLNLKDPRAVEVAKGLVKVSDVAIENFGTGVIERFGLSYEELRKVKPDIIMLSSTGLGRSGPFKNAIGYYAEVHNFAGISYLTGYRDGRPGQVGAIWADHLTGTLLVYTVLAALRHRRKSGEGQYIEVSMAEHIISSMPERILDYSLNGRHQEQEENRDVAWSPHNVYRCDGSDKWVAIAVTNEEEWRALCQAMGHPEWMDDERFADPVTRWHNQEKLDKLITEWTLQRTDYEAMHTLQKAGVPAGVTLNSEGLVNDPHLNERGCFIPLGEVEGNPYVHPALPWRLSDCPPPAYRLAPAMGEHNNYLLGDLLGMSEVEIARLTEDKVLV